MPDTKEVPKGHSWFVLVKESEDIVELTKMLATAILSARKEGKLLKVSVQKLDIEDTF